MQDNRKHVDIGSRPCAMPDEKADRSIEDTHPTPAADGRCIAEATRRPCSTPVGPFHGVGRSGRRFPAWRGRCRTWPRVIADPRDNVTSPPHPSPRFAFPLQRLLINSGAVPGVFSSIFSPERRAVPVTGCPLPIGTVLPRDYWRTRRRAGVTGSAL
jgi:hypothetical protein